MINDLALLLRELELIKEECSVLTWRTSAVDLHVEGNFLVMVRMPMASDLDPIGGSDVLRPLLHQTLMDDLGILVSDVDSNLAVSVLD